MHTKTPSGLIERLSELSSLNGISGFEEPVRDYILRCCLPYAGEAKTDAAGNLYLFRRGKKRTAKPMLFTAHMDEVGMIVKEITEDGYIRFGLIGGIDIRILPGKRVRIGERMVPGIIAMETKVYGSTDEPDRYPGPEDFFIDIGAADRQEALNKVFYGDPVSFVTKPCLFGDGKIKAKAIDDRAGCAVLMELMEEEPFCDTWFAFLVQEEAGLTGAKIVRHHIDPAAAVILEGSSAVDYPDVPAHRRVTSLGMGPVISYTDQLTVYHAGLVKSVMEIADKNEIPWQMKTLPLGGNDAGAISVSEGGTACVSVSVPVRYIHSPHGIASLKDIQNTMELARCLITEGGMSI